MSKGRPSPAVPYTPGGRVPDKPCPAPGNYDPKGNPSQVAFDDPRPIDPMMAAMGYKRSKNWDPRDSRPCDCEGESEAE